MAGAMEAYDKFKYLKPERAQEGVFSGGGNRSSPLPDESKEVDSLDKSLADPQPKQEPEPGPRIENSSVIAVKDTPGKEIQNPNLNYIWTGPACTEGRVSPGPGEVVAGTQ